MIDNVALSNQFEPISAAESLEINGGAAQLAKEVGGIVLRGLRDWLIGKMAEITWNGAVDYYTNAPKINTWNYNGPRC